MSEALVKAGWVSRPIVGVDLEPLSARVNRVHLRYDEPCRRIDGGNPERIVVKSMNGLPAAEVSEADIYAELSETPAVPTPRGTSLQDSDGTTIALLLADVGQPTVELSTRMLRLAVDRLARMHAHCWGTPPPTLPASAAGPRGAPMTLVHGALDASHTIVDGGRAHFVGWASAQRGPGVLDLAALFAAAAPHQEWELVLRYQAGLVRGGVQDYSPGRCWDDYAHAAADVSPSPVALAA